MTDTIKIANCSGFYGDKLSAAKDMVDGGPIDVLTGDYLAELTMTILYNQRSKKPDAGYVGTFLKQVKDVLATCMEKNIKIVTNAGGLNPSGMAVAVSEIAKELNVKIDVLLSDYKNELEDFAINMSFFLEHTFNFYTDLSNKKEKFDNDIEKLIKVNFPRLYKLENSLYNLSNDIIAIKFIANEKHL